MKLKRTGQTALMFCALAVPTLSKFSSGPYPSFYSQVAATGFWGGFVYMFSLSSPSNSPAPLEFLKCVCSIVFAYQLLAIGSHYATDLPWGMVAAICAATFAALIVGYGGVRADARTARSFIWAVAVCSLLNCIPALLQAFGPQNMDNAWIAKALSPERSEGNIRQPNLLATMSALGMTAVIALVDMRQLSVRKGALALAVLALTVACSGSRVGLLEIVFIGFYGLGSRRLRPTSRRLAMSCFAMALCFWAILQAWSHLSGSVHARAPELSSGRYAMWMQCLHLIAANPFVGVGLGNFNFAWTLTPGDRSNPETFDNAHNLIVQWAVELGIPCTLALLATGFCLIRSCVRRTRGAVGIDYTTRHFCLLMGLLVLLHSLTEYPLWYSYFMLPTAFAFGIAGSPSSGGRAGAAFNANREGAVNSAGAALGMNWLGIAALLMALGSAFAVRDYQHIVDIFHPYHGAPPIEQRVAEGRKALLYGYLADRLAGTLAVNGTRKLEPFKTATRQLLDMRLLIAWSLAMRETGHLDKARYLAQRVKDFNDPVSKQFFEKCSQPNVVADERPWQCTPPSGHYTHEDFL